MKIVIAGAGEVGIHLAKMLSIENHEIVVIDKNEKKLETLSSHLDLMTLEGNATSIRDLMVSGTSKADLFIAVTPYESDNLNACVFAHNMGAKKTLARIDNQEYLQSANLAKFKELGINSLIYPELLASQEIIESLKSTWHRFKMTFSNKLFLFGIKIRENAPVINKQFKTGFLDHARFRVVAIKRENETIIPKGDDQILVGDMVFFITTEENIEFTREQAGKSDYSIKNVMIMGGSRIAVKMGLSLPDKIKAKIIETDYEKCTEISEKLNRVLVIHGDGRDMELLKEEGITDMDAFVALTGNSETNILACLVAKRYGVAKTIAEIENNDYIPLAHSLDIGTIINKKLIAASNIYQQTLDESVLNVKCLPMSDAHVLEFVVKDGSKISKGKLRELNIPAEVNFGAYIHNGESYICSGDTKFQEGDHVIVFCFASGIKKIEKFFN